MERKNRNRGTRAEGENNSVIYIAVSVLTVAIIAFVASFIFYGNYADDHFEIGSTGGEQANTNQSENRIELQTAETSSSMGKSVNEMAEEPAKEKTEKVAVNTNATEVKQVEKKKQEQTKADAEKAKKEAEVEQTNIEEKVENPIFEKPVEGTIKKGFAKDNLVYSDTLKEWTTHNGVDIEAEKTTVVKTAAEGKVKAIKNDPRYGITVVVEHANGFQTVYANLLSTEFVIEGEELEKGRAIGTVGNTATFEIADGAHLHFEMLKEGEYLDPELYISE